MFASKKISNFLNALGHEHKVIDTNIMLHTYNSLLEDSICIICPFNCIGFNFLKPMQYKTKIILMFLSIEK